MRTLPDALTTAQQAAPLVWPKVRIRIKRLIGATRRLDFDRLYTGVEPDGFHAIAAPSDGSLNRFRVDPTGNKLYRQRIENADDEGPTETFGMTTIGGEDSTFAQDTKLACRYNCPTARQATSILWYGAADSGTIKAKAVIYTDNANSPNALLATSTELTGIGTSPAWHTFTFAAPVSLTAGYYWLGITIDDNTGLFYYDAGATDQLWTNADTYEDGPTDPFGEGSIKPDYAISILAITAHWHLWTDTGQTAKAIAAHANGADILLAYVDDSSPYHVFVTASDDNGATWGAPVDTGAVSDTNGRVAVALKANGTALVIYTRGAQLYARKRTASVWGAESSSAYTFSSISGIAMLYEGDFNIAVTAANSSSQDGLWSTIYGDGYSQALNTWATPKEIMLRESTEPFSYTAPFVDHPDEYRCFFVERYTDPTTQDRVCFTFCPTTADWVDVYWREPIPFDLETIYGLAITHTAGFIWLSTPYGVWASDYGPAEWDITSDVIEILETDAPNRYRSRLKVVLDNRGNRYRDFNKLGYEITFGKGYLTGEGPLYSDGPSFWITSWRFVSPPWYPLRMIYPAGVIGTLEIHCEGFWDLTKRFRFRRDISWAAGDKNCWQILAWIVARLGFDLQSAGVSSTATNLEPPLTIPAGTQAYTVLKKILSWLPDVLFQRASTLYLKELDPDEENDYTYDNFYGVSHIVYRGNYGIGGWDPNRAQVWGDTFMAEGFEFPQIQQVYDRLEKVTTPEYPNITRATERAAAMLRKGQVLAANPGWLQVPTNCGQEPFDVITITDTTAGVIAIHRRVLSVKTYWLTPFTYWQVFELGAP